MKIPQDEKSLILNKGKCIFSKQYDYKIVDNTWRCVFCHQKSHYKVSPG
jgi:hypothetical protein